MTRPSLVRDAKRLGVATTKRVNGVSYILTTDHLRVALLERIYGPNLGSIGGTLAEIDTGITRSVATREGKHGPNLQASQRWIRKANTARGEALRLAAATMRDWDAIDKLLKAAGDFLAMAIRAQHWHNLELSLRDDTPTDKVAETENS
jgi:hypothetical protein